MLLRLALACVLLAGCATTNWQCPANGVQENGPIGPLKAIHEESATVVQGVCGIGHSGCVMPVDGGWELWFVEGDWCAMRHEFAHLTCGLYHTIEYERILHFGDPADACKLGG